MSYFLNKTLGKISAGLSNSGNGSKDSASHAAAALASNNGTTVSKTGGGLSSFFQRGQQQQQSAASQLQQDAQLTLTHLRKTFYELLHPKAGLELTQNERDEKLYSILPLFIKAFGHSSLEDIEERFNDSSEFCFCCSRLLVSEIGKRVHDDLVLVKFFEMKTTTDSLTDGAGLLNAVNLLASGPVFLVEIMTKCSLPSRLVMCIYLFICLPEPKDGLLDNCEFNAKERRILFQKCFQQLIIKLCQFPCTCEELVEADSMKLSKIYTKEQ